MTVREAFSKAFGEVPEGATCHVGYSHMYEGITLGPTLLLEGKLLQAYWSPTWDESSADDEAGPDIANRPAESFKGFFGAEFDKILDEIPPQTPPQMNLKFCEKLCSPTSISQ